MNKIREDILKILKYVAENPIKEEEYAGRMEDYCVYCGKWQDPKKDQRHDKDCLSKLAQSCLERIKNSKK